jgi:hypothetical protein
MKSSGRNLTLAAIEKGLLPGRTTTGDTAPRLRTFPSAPRTRRFVPYAVLADELFTGARKRLPLAAPPPHPWESYFPETT